VATGTVSAAAELEDGWVEREVALEWPELRLLSLAVDARPGRSSRGLRERLRVLSDRFYGARAVTLRREAVPAAYRAFFRQVGIDPDAERTPVEAAAVRRLMDGGFASTNRVDDALLIAVVETGVPVWALDDDRLDGPIGLRAATPGERLGEGEYAHDAPPGRIVVADARGPLAVLFGRIADSHVPGGSTRRMRLFAVQVAGVPAIHVEEALSTCAEALEEG
jgi:DNA/RNA-binding domain of Phe-tRNA-synthetase-like protein